MVATLSQAFNYLLTAFVTPFLLIKTPQPHFYVDSEGEFKVHIDHGNINAWQPLQDEQAAPVAAVWHPYGGNVDSAFLKESPFTPASYM